MSSVEITRIKSQPKDQIYAYLHWFSQAGIQSFDIHVKSKIKADAGNINEKTFRWITHHENICENQILKLLPWLCHENANGGEIYFRPHRHSDVAVLFVDDLPVKMANALAEKYGSLIVLTSENNTQVWLKTTKILTREERKIEQRHLSKLGWGDPGSISGDHLGRLPGMKSQKRKCWVNLIAFSSALGYNPQGKNKTISPTNFARQRVSSFYSNSASEKEFGWTLGMLKSGKQITYVKERLKQVAESRGKRSVDNYVEMTVQKALNLVENLKEFDRF